jgi:hypothetical protein
MAAMSPEEYERLKEAEKEHLRKMRQLKRAVHELERQKKVSRAVHDMTEEPRRLLDEQEDLVNQIAIEAAQSEARLDIALESAEAKAPAEPAGISVEEADEVLRRARARELVRRMQEGEDVEPKAQAGTASSAQKPESKETGGEEDATPPLPEKTIGRMKP